MGERPGPPSEELTIGIGRSGGTVVVTLKGALDTLGATRLAATLGDLIEGQGNLAVSVELRGVHRLAPSGVQVISVTASALERCGGRLALCGARGPVLRALELAGLTRFIAFDEDESGAVPGSARRSRSQLQTRRPPDAHPAGSSRQPNRQGGRDDRA